MHPEVESQIRVLARSLVIAEIQDRSMYCRAAEEGVISFDDIYFLGIVNGADSSALDKIAQVEGIPIFEQDSPVFRQRLNANSFVLTAELYNCSPRETEERCDSIHRKVTSYYNKRLEDRKPE
jgi:hypothetical protein